MRLSWRKNWTALVQNAPAAALCFVLCIASMSADAQGFSIGVGVEPRDATPTPESGLPPPPSGESDGMPVSPAPLLRLFAPPPPPPPLSAPPPTIANDLFEPGQLLVMWPDEITAAQGLAVMLQRHQQTPRQQAALDQLDAVLAMFQLPTTADALNLRDQLRREQPDWLVDLNARAEPLQLTQASGEPMQGDVAALLPTASTAPARLYALRMMGIAPAAPDAVARPGELFRLGVIDTALDVGSLMPAPSAPLWNGSRIAQHSVLDSADTPAPTTHGMAMALLIAGAALPNGFAGAAPEIDIAWASAMRRSGGKTMSNSFLLAVAFNWLAGRQVTLINFSGGGAGDDILRAVVAKVLAKRISVVAAAGNSPDTKPVYPAAYPGVWAITAVDAQRRPYVNASRGDYASFAAPGVDVWTPDATSLLAQWQAGAATDVSPIAGRYGSGTSLASALAAGALAHLPRPFWLLDVGDRHKQLCRLMRSATVSPVSALGLPESGCGLLQVRRVSAGGGL
jgi:hypothetical protein